MSLSSATTFNKLWLIVSVALVCIGLFVISVNFQPKSQVAIEEISNQVDSATQEYSLVQAQVADPETAENSTHHTADIQGLVVHSSNEPLSGIKIVARRIRDDGSSGANYPLGKPLYTLTSSNGSFAFEGIQAGRYQVNVASEQGFIATSPLIYPEQNLTFELSSIAEIQISGQVIDTNFQGVANVEVSMAGSPQRSIYSDERGYYEFTTETSGHYYLSFKAQGYHPTHKVFSNKPGSPTIDLPAITLHNIEQLHTLTGKLVDHLGNPIANESIHLLSSSFNINKKATSNTEGAFYLNDLPTTHDYQLHVRTRGPFESYQQSNLTIDEDTQTLVIRLQPVSMAQLSGQLVDENGYAIPNLSLQLSSTSLRGANITLKSDEHGYFSASNLPSGPINLTSYSKPLTHISGVSLDPFETTNIQIQLDVGDSYIHGEITDITGNPVENAQITIEKTVVNEFKVRSLRTTNSTSNGSFNFEQISGGEHLIKIKATGFTTRQMLVTPQQTWVSIQLLSH